MKQSSPDAATIHSLTRQVQRNCHIVDARYGANYTLCIYLIKMREFYRWEKGLGFDASLPREDVGEWLSQREALWDDLQDSEFQPLQIGDQNYDPFDSEAINQQIHPLGLAYSGGLAQAGRPHFFLGQLEELQHTPLCVVGQELARDLAAPPAMTANGQVFLRRESLKRMLWEKLENWRWSRADNPMGRALACYDFDGDLDGSLEAMTNAEVLSVAEHEQGEVIAGKELGDDWNQMLLELAQTPAELIARAVRDHWADCIRTLPALLQIGEPARIHFYAGNLGGMRKDLFPGFLDAYHQWLETTSTEALESITIQGAEHWRAQALRMLDHWQQAPETAALFIRQEREKIRL